VTGAAPRFQFYGRRKGKALRRHHLALTEGLLPGLRIECAAPLNGTGAARWLEIGFGGGEHLAHQAALHPDVTLLGAEAFVNGVAKLLAEVERRALGNVRIHDGDARDLLRALPDQCLERIYLLYPDPWPKARHNKRRFVNAENLSQMARVLKPGGLFLFASDIPDYVDWTLVHVAEASVFRLLSNVADPFENWVETRYEAKARREGRTSRYLSFRRA
jgi:tRNA (guanine-N7-)-methyltransferase